MFCLWHDLPTCPTLATVSTFEDFVAWRSDIYYRVGTVHPPTCFLCHVPRGIHSRFDGDPSNCEYRDMIAPLVYGILTSPVMRHAAQRRFRSADLSSPASAMRWINGVPIRFPSNLIAITIWFCRSIY